MKMNANELMAVARQIHRQANGPMAWNQLTHAGRQYFADRLRDAINEAQKEDALRAIS